VPAFEDSFMRRMKQQRYVEVIAPSFLSLGGLVVGTQRVATVHRRLAQHFASYAPLAMRELPFFVPPIREAVQWHITSNNDAGLRWVIERIALAAVESSERLRAESAGTVVELNKASRTEP
jgi:LysR family nod box-dependent transcriptional activator